MSTQICGGFSSIERSKLTGIETSATIDQSDAEIKTAIEAGDSPITFYEKLQLSDNQINEIFSNAEASIYFNYVGYGGGTTQFRNFKLGTGKSSVIAEFFGSNKQTVLHGPLVIPTHTPASSGAVGVQGQLAWDATHFYVCVAPNTWLRCAIASW